MCIHQVQHNYITIVQVTTFSNEPICFHCLHVMLLKIIEGTMIIILNMKHYVTASYNSYKSQIISWHSEISSQYKHEKIIL